MAADWLDQALAGLPPLTDDPEEALAALLYDAQLSAINEALMRSAEGLPASLLFRAVAAAHAAVIAALTRTDADNAEEEADDAY
jgi:hypothetical protein